MKKLLLMIPAFLFLNAGDVDKGKRYYLKAQCQRCHLQDADFDPNSVNKEGMVSKVKDLQSLKSWVVSCDNYFEVGWFPEEIDDVVRYLNSVHYRFKE
ncbi:hypothetical protein [Nitratifractor sp.]